MTSDKFVAVTTFGPYSKVVGEPIDLLVDERYSEGVGYIVVNYNPKTGANDSPVGTVFFVRCTVEGISIDYAVSCRHVIKEAFRKADGSAVSIRVNAPGGAKNFQCAEQAWVYSEVSDIAVTHVAPEVTKFVLPYPIDSPTMALRPGQQVFFVGLFKECESAGDRQIWIRRVESC